MKWCNYCRFCNQILLNIKIQFCLGPQQHNRALSFPRLVPPCSRTSSHPRQLVSPSEPKYRRQSGATVSSCRFPVSAPFNAVCSRRRSRSSSFPCWFCCHLVEVSHRALISSDGGGIFCHVSCSFTALCRIAHALHTSRSHALYVGVGVAAQGEDFQTAVT